MDMTKNRFYKNTIESGHTKNSCSACIGIAGLGGLGSNIAMMLARSGVRRFVLADFDVVDESNLNRQHYFPSHLGRKKTECIKEQLLALNPALDLEIHDTYIDSTNAALIFKDCTIVCEAFDRPECKSELVTALLSQLKNTIVVSGSGMAGFESANTIVTKHPLKRLYLCGDGTTDVNVNGRLTAPRVQICAGHEAHMVLRLLHGITEP